MGSHYSLYIADQSKGNFQMLVLLVLSHLSF